MHSRWLVLGSIVVLAACGDDATATDGGTGTDGGSTTADGGVTPDGGATVDGGAGADGGVAITGITNAPATCAMEGYTFASPENAGHYAAARLTPPTFPFTVRSVTYALVHTPGSCNADAVHEVRVFAAAGVTPPATPAGVTMSVPAPATPTAASSVRRVDVTLATPVVVNAGEDLFVAVQLLATGDPICISECLDTGTADRNWWSAAPAPPFAWRTLASYGNDGTLLIWARED